MWVFNIDMWVFNIAVLWLFQLGDTDCVDEGRTRLPPTQFNDGGAWPKVSLLLPLQNSFMETLVNILCPVTINRLCIEQWTNSTVKMTLLEMWENGGEAKIILCLLKRKLITYVTDQPGCSGVSSNGYDGAAWAVLWQLKCSPEWWAEQSVITYECLIVSMQYY